MRRRFECFALVIALALVAPASAQFDNVGSLSFPTSGSPAAQQRFLRGVAILHSFGWKQAIAEFKLAQQAQPDFAMAYWGETLCYNHPLQNEQDPKNPRAVLARLGPTGECSSGKGAHRRRPSTGRSVQSGSTNTFRREGVCAGRCTSGLRILGIIVYDPILVVVPGSLATRLCAVC